MRIGHEGSSRVNPFNKEALKLYVLEGSQLRQVMSDLVVGQFPGEWDGNCAGEFNQTKRTLTIGKPGKDGFANG